MSLDFLRAECASLSCKNAVSGREAGGVNLCNSFRCLESIIEEDLLELQCVGRKRIKGFGVRSIAKVEIKRDVHCLAYMLTAESCDQRVPNACRSPARCFPTVSPCFPR